MATATLPPPAAPAVAATVPTVGGVLLRDVAWGDYEAMLRIVGDRHIRVTHDRGAMEIAMPSPPHELLAQLLGMIVGRFAEERDIPYETLGMTTWRKASVGRGLEADGCFYIEHQALVRRGTPLDLETAPPPDLAIEVDVASSSLDRMGIYAVLGFPEIWRHNRRGLTFLELGSDREYHARPDSRSLPGLTPSDVMRFVDRGAQIDKTHWTREFRTWVAEEFSRRSRP